MGLFDYIRCQFPLPVKEAQEEVFQTKDLENFLGDFVIREDGTLWNTEYDYEDQSDPDATGLRALAGKLTRVNPRQVYHPHVGPVVFYSEYTYTDPETGSQAKGQVEFEAIFRKGKMTHLAVLHHNPPPLKKARELGENMAQNLPEGFEGKVPGRDRF